MQGLSVLRMFSSYQNEVVEDEERDNDGQEYRCAVGDDYHTAQYHQERVKCDLYQMGHQCVNGFNVLREPVGNPASWCCVEEGHGSLQYICQHSVMQNTCRVNRPETPQEGEGQHGHSCKSYVITMAVYLHSTE